MKYFKEYNFGDVSGYEMGYSPIGRPIMNVYFYQLGGILIDTGQSRMGKTFCEIVKEKRLDAVLLTHHHEDHSGNAALSAEVTGATVYGNPMTVEKMRKGFNILPYQKLVWGRARPLEMEGLPARVEAGGVTLVPVHTPGHSKDHTAFYEPRRGMLFSGDLFLAPRIKYFRADEIMLHTIESLKKVRDLDFDALFCAHNPQTTGGKAMVEQKLSFMEDFYGQVERLRGEGNDVKGIMKGMGKEELRFVKYFTFGNVSLAHMIRSALKTIEEEQK